MQTQPAVFPLLITIGWYGAFNRTNENVVPRFDFDLVNLYLEIHSSIIQKLNFDGGRDEK